VYHAVYNNFSNEAIMIHVQEVINFSKLKGFYTAYKKAKIDFMDSISKTATALKKIKYAQSDLQPPRKG
jgi:hypothetical protein